ncbi:MAG: hypothetical protein H7X89_05670 [Rhizobiales bacterium]|nr:hypothetical protein [Hyphomicrobiales bacterium]
MRKTLWTGAFALALAGLSTMALAEERKLTGDEIKAALSDKKVAGTTENGAGWTQSFKANGDTLYQLVGTEAQNGAWEVQGERFCSQWPPDPAWVCYDVTGENDRVTFISDTGKTWPGKVLP